METQLLATARRAAAAGAEVILERWGRAETVRNKAAFDFATEVDLAAQEAVLAVITERHPGHAVLAEEGAGDYQAAGGAAGVLWVVDPLDGTTNFIHGFPQVAVSVAALVDGQPAAGVVRDVTRGEEFAAARGQGTTLNGRAVGVSRQDELGRSLLLTGFPFRDKERLGRYLELFAELFGQVAGVRRAGAAALDLAYVAAGRAEGFWELGLKPWDMAAGILLVQEAGGKVSDFDGGHRALWRGDIVAGSQEVHPWLQEACGRWFPGG